jgi:6-phosphogluconolactonase
MSDSEHSLIIGAYTETLPFVTGVSAGLLGATYDPRTGALGPVTVLARTRNPSYATVNPAGDRVYVVNETTDFAGQPGGGLTAFARDPATGQLRELGSRSSLGDAPCFLSIDPASGALFTANYNSGSLTAVALEPDGSLGARHWHVQHEGSSLDPDRQSSAHVHMTTPEPGTSNVLATDLGMDAIMTYRLTDDGLAEQPGAGPRHLAFHPDGQHVFLVCELGSVVLTLRRTGDTLTLVHNASTLPSGFSGQTLAGAVRVSPSGEYVYASNRGHDSIAMFRFDPAAATLTLVHVEPCGGNAPRDFNLTPEGDRLIVANQDSHSLVVLDIDESAETLRPVAQVEAPSPSCVVFAP